MVDCRHAGGIDGRDIGRGAPLAPCRNTGWDYMTEILLRRELEPAAQQQHRVALLHRLTRWWVALIAIAIGAIVLQHFVAFPAAPLFVVLGGVLVLAGIG